MSPPGRMEQGLEQREEWREPSMSPSGRMGQGVRRFRFVLEELIVLWYTLISSSAREGGFLQ